MATNPTAAQIIAAIRLATLPAGTITKIVAIDGGGGAGKSTLARHLASAMGNAYIIHMDDFIHGRAPIPTGGIGYETRCANLCWLVRPLITSATMVPRRS
ncbi:(d)CMP kinase [Candidatus Saccharibacteria bacterium]|nr:(d)CMP kinase [Candidatus Saccharibacteria bacterium]